MDLARLHCGPSFFDDRISHWSTRASQRSEDNCVANVNLPGPFGFGLNCDSPELIWLAREPSGLLTKNSYRQSRPGLIIAAAILQVPLSLVVPFGAPPQKIGWGDVEGINKLFKNNLPTYLAYVLLNIGILIASFFILRRVMEREHDRRAIHSASALLIVSTGLLLVANDVTKAFVWSPHMQMFNILVPVLSLYVTLRLLRGGLSDRSFVLGIGLKVGLGLTAYAFFVVVTACAIPDSDLDDDKGKDASWARCHAPNRIDRAERCSFVALVCLCTHDDGCVFPC